ncbi:MAG: 2-phospho-L-lactate guanylyltransferase [Chloroflexota bacterium]|nr:2-phospho-L-lactate guanylyltransferase [Dehalococcoidia bacterium]MDW8254417.1 2-phospho-L-lactate guanylyltransferase [Chloroflexota bacterium]
MIVAVVPVKPFPSAKSRLAGVLSPADREALARGLFRHTLDVLLSASPIDRLVVVGEPVAHPAVLTIPDPTLGLNAAVAAGVAAARNADAVLVVPADLPFLSPAAIAQLVERRAPIADVPHVVIAPDRRHDGTNALLLTPPTLLSPAFGPGSFAAHRQAAAAAGALLAVHSDPAFAFDLDLPDDLAALPRQIVDRLLALGTREAFSHSYVVRR